MNEANCAEPRCDDGVLLDSGRDYPRCEARQIDRRACEQVLDWRTRAARDHQIVFDHIERYGEHSAQRLFTRSFVAQVQRLSRLGHLDLGYTPWGQA
ncbi:hypothetical protein [Streptomyces chattanoogensis]|uniref:hypothetical protein n=1 Tax=Streptomyces chattanoogensis TaxID=66876 RepID=UPI00367628BE